MLEKFFINNESYILSANIYFMQNYNKNQTTQEIQSSQSKSLFQRRNTVINKSLSQVLQKLRKNSEGTAHAEISALRIIRRQKQKQERKVFYKDIYQDTLKPADAIPRVFSESKPINTGDFFFDVKQKAKLLFSERAYSKNPMVFYNLNLVVAGAPRKRILTETPLQKHQWISRKFSQYDRLVTQQTGPLRILLKKKIDAQQGYILKKPISNGKTNSINDLFSNYDSDKINFYPDLKQTISTNAFTSKCRTLASLQSSTSVKEFQIYQKYQTYKTKKLLKSSFKRKISTQAAQVN